MPTLFNSRKKSLQLPHCSSCFPTKPPNPSLSVELLLVRLHIHTALELSTGSADLEPDDATGDSLVKLAEALHSTILHRVFQPGRKIGHELANRSGDIVSQLLFSYIRK